MTPVRVLIADDEALIRRALRVFVESDARTVVVGEAVNGEQATKLCAEISPDVVLMDIQMPVMNGIVATRAISDSSSLTRALAVTTFSQERYVVSALRAGASGYLVKDTHPEQIIEAILDVHDGQFVLSPHISHELVRAVKTAGSHEKIELGPEHERLTSRELTIVNLLAKGMSNAEIGVELEIAETTVKAHFGRIMEKWHTRDRVQVLIRATQAGLVNL